MLTRGSALPPLVATSNERWMNFQANDLTPTLTSLGWPSVVGSIDIAKAYERIWVLAAVRSCH
jgi:hypothetical protein